MERLFRFAEYDACDPLMSTARTWRQNVSATHPAAHANEFMVLTLNPLHPVTIGLIHRCVGCVGQRSQVSSRYSAVSCRQPSFQWVVVRSQTGVSSGGSGVDAEFWMSAPLSCHPERQRRTPIPGNASHPRALPLASCAPKSKDPRPTYPKPLSHQPDVPPHDGNPHNWPLATDH